MNVKTIFTKTAIYLLIGFSLLLTVLFYAHSGQIGFQDRGLSNQLGAWSVLAACLAVGIWVSRKMYIQVKKRKVPDFDLAKQTLLYLRKHHILLGWATIATASAHGIYYLLLYPNRRGEIYTGLIAWLALAMLIGLGVWLDYRLAAKKSPKQVRMYHITLAVIFILAMFLHVM